MKKIILIPVLLFTLISCDNKEKDCLVELEQKEIEIDALKKKILELQEEIDSRNSHNLVYENNLNSLNEKKISLLEQELEFDKTRSLKREVFYGMIENSDYEKDIESYTYTNYQNPLLSKVSVNIQGTENIINFYSQLYSQYHLLYMISKTK